MRVTRLALAILQPAAVVWSGAKRQAGNVLPRGRLFFRDVHWGDMPVLDWKHQ